MKIHTVPLHIGDLLGGTSHMDATEFGAYASLFLTCYQASDHRLPADEDRLARMARVSNATWRRIRDVVMAKFKKDDAGWFHARVNAEVEKIKNLSSKNQANVLKRWNREDTTVLPKPYEEPKNDGKTSQKPEAKKQETKYTPEFDQFWMAWPKERRCEKPTAFKAWKEAVRKLPVEQLIECERRYLLLREPKEGFAPYPAKWLKRERWLEVLEEDKGEISKANVTLADLGGDTEDNRALLRLFEIMKLSHGDAVFRSWLSPLRVKERTAEKLTLKAPTRFVSGWVAQHYGDELSTAAKQCWQGIKTVELTH